VRGDGLPGTILLPRGGAAQVRGGANQTTEYDTRPALLEKQRSAVAAAHTWGSGLVRRNSEYPLYDGHGSERTVTDGSETVTGTVNFEAFGQTVGSTGSSSSPYMYAGNWGYRTDGDAGLMHVGARYYDPQVGRWASRDAVLNQHPYLYSVHSPVDCVDPSGRGFEVLGLKVTWGQLGAAIGGAIGTMEPGVGTVIGIGVGRFVGGLFDGESFGDAVKAGAVDGAVAYVGIKVLEPAVGGVIGKLFPPPVIDPVTKSFVWRMWAGGRFRLR
jgi:RHS repeat-associated protein